MTFGGKYKIQIEFILYLNFKEEKEEIRLSPMTKAPTLTEKSPKKQRRKSPQKTFTTQRLRTDLGR